MWIVTKRDKPDTVDYYTYNKYKKYAVDEEKRGHILVSAVVGTVMAFIVCGRLFESHGYGFSTVVYSVIVVASLWFPYIQMQIVNRKDKRDA